MLQDRPSGIHTFIHTFARTFTPSFTLAALLALALVSLPSGASGQECPVGGVLDDQRAYFGTTLSANVCASANARCENVFFFSRQTRTTAICDDGGWRPLEDAGASRANECPSFVFSLNEVWQRGAYAPNACSEATATRCGSTPSPSASRARSSTPPASSVIARTW